VILFNAAPGPELPAMKTFAGGLVRNHKLLDRFRAMTMVEIR
jgi:hypothetical protein